MEGQVVTDFRADIERLHDMARRAAGRQWGADILRLIATRAEAEGDEVLRRDAADASEQINAPHRRPDEPETEA